MKKNAQQKHIIETTAIVTAFVVTFLLLVSVGIIYSPPQYSYSVYANNNSGYLQLDPLRHFALLFFIPLAFVLFAVFSAKGFPQRDLRGKEEVIPFAAVLVLAVAARILFAVSTSGYVNDVYSFKAWGYRMVHTGPIHYYADDFFCDYPPGYLYLLAIPQWITELFSVDLMSQTATMIYKMPAIISEAVLGILIYRNSYREYGHHNALLLSALVLFNPAFVTDSSVWGQIESIMILLIVLAYLFAEQDKIFPSAFAFVAAILIKPQALMMGPVFLLYTIVWMIKKGKQGVLKGIAAIICSILAFGLVSLPFWMNRGIAILAEKYFGTMTSYPYITLNAMNIYQLFGLNAQVVNKVAWGLMLKTWGTIGILFSIAAGTVTFFLKRKQHPLLYSAVVMQYALYLFGPYMHERYLLLTVALLILLMGKTKDKRYLWVILITSVVQFVSMMTVLRVMHFQRGDFLVTGMSSLNIVGFFLLLFFVITERQPYLSTLEQIPVKKELKEEKQKRTLLKLKEKQLRHHTKWSVADFLIILVVTAVYSVVAFYKLGDTSWPKTYWQPEEWAYSYDVDLGEAKQIAYIQILEGIGQGSLEIFYSEDGLSWTDSGASVETNYADFLSWTRTEVSVRARYLRFSIKEVGLRIYECAVYDVSGARLEVYSIDADGTNDEFPFENAFDEQECVPVRPTYMNGTYFDEVYHARTAYEQSKGWAIYEQTHPPLGKDLIMLGIQAFGMSPFGWRFMGTLAGVIMLPALYVFGRLLFEKRRWAAMLMIMMALDFMHFVQTRIATIDSFAVLFIILMYLFMFLFLKQDYYSGKHRKKLVPLFFSGVFFGAASAVKWIGFYAGAGLAVLLFSRVITGFTEYCAAKRMLKQNRELSVDDQSLLEHVKRNYYKNTLIILLSCVVFFIIVPAALYVLSYIPYLRAEGQSGSLLTIVLKNQEYIFNYHSKYVLNMQSHPHPYQSRWYTWPIMGRPLFCYMGEYLPKGMVEGISTFGNPAIWWTGIIAFAWVCFTVLGDTARRMDIHENNGKKRTRVFIIIALLAQFIPWIFVKRSTYIYHYFATTPFLMMCIVCFFEDLLSGTRKRSQMIWIIAYLSVCFLLFVLFYPLLSGLTIPAAYAKHFRWLPGWVLYAYWQ